MASQSHKYDLGRNELNKPDYYVELTEKHLSNFEIWNSLCSNESYDMLLYLCEQYLNMGRFPVIPSEVIAVLFTLASIGDHNKGSLIKKADPFDTGRELLTRRSMKLLETLLDILQTFDTDLYEIYDLELLRCQFFYFIDSIRPENGRALVLDPLNAQSSRATRRSFKLSSRSAEGGSLLSVEPLYGSYINLIGDDTSVFKTTMVHSALSQEGSFWNGFSWALSTFMIGHENEDQKTDWDYELAKAWLSVFKLIFIIYELRQDYYIDSKTETIEKSPIFRLLEAVDKKNQLKGLVQYLFVGCVECEILYPVSPSLNDPSTSNASFNQFHEDKDYRAAFSMDVRKDTLCVFVRFLDRYERHLQSYPFTLDALYGTIVDALYSDLKISSFKQFFLSCDVEKDRNLITTLVEKLLNKAFSNVEPRRTFNIVNKMSNFEEVTSELMKLLRAIDRSAAFNRSRISKRRIQMDFCIIILTRLIITTHPQGNFEELLRVLTTFAKSPNSFMDVKDVIPLFEQTY